MLRESECREGGGEYLGTGRDCEPNACLINWGGALFLHTDPDLEYTGSGRDYLSEFTLKNCEDADVSVEGEGVHVFFVTVNFPERSVPRLIDAAFALRYDESKVEVIDWGTTADVEDAMEGWPASGTGTRIEWFQPKESHLIPLYWFAASFMAGSETTLHLVPHPDLGAGFGSDGDLGIRRSALCLGSMGFDAEGSSCCRETPTGACCFGEETCAILSSSDCVEAGGDFLAHGTCAPYGCVSVVACCTGYSIGCATLTNRSCPFVGWGWAYEGECEPGVCDWPAVQVSGVSVTQRGLHVEISWSASSDVGLSRFAILRGKSEDQPSARLDTLDVVPGTPLRYEDRSAEPGKRYYYWLEGVEISGATTLFGPHGITLTAPTSPLLLSQAPNPLRIGVTFRFFLPKAGESTLRIYDPGGRKVRSIDLGRIGPGVHEATWDRRDNRGAAVARGVYYFTIETGSVLLLGRPLIVP